SDFLVQASLEANQSIPPGIVHLTRSTTLTARSLDGDDWSGPATQTFIVGTTPASADNLVISEIMYNPAGAGQSEYIELMNISTGPIDLSGTAFTRGIDFTFPAGNQSVLQPGARTLVAVDATGTSLDNSGETITLTALDGQPIRHFKYNDKAPWPEAADGRGFSLVLDLPNTNPDHSLAKNWRSSVAPGGSPGTTDTLTFTGDPNADPDQNGLTALLEFATADHDTTSIDAGLVFSFRRNLAAANVRYTVERSTDLITWHADTTFVDETNHTDGTATLRYRPPTEAGNQYLRLKVTLL
ncbi:MAG: lamin tail domain-containing protein, partial [Verrucomicrobiales bacterium]|nr:lamin tail domain-containing protein [Verrucomicrobiales bacterium]